MSLLFFAMMTFAKESWFCTEESSQIKDGSIYACGIGYGNSEAQARDKALAASKK